MLPPRPPARLVRLVLVRLRLGLVGLRLNVRHVLVRLDIRLGLVGLRLDIRHVFVRLRLEVRLVLQFDDLRPGLYHFLGHQRILVPGCRWRVGLLVRLIAGIARNDRHNRLFVGGRIVGGFGAGWIVRTLRHSSPFATVVMRQP